MGNWLHGSSMEPQAANGLNPGANTCTLLVVANVRIRFSSGEAKFASEVIIAPRNYLVPLCDISLYRLANILGFRIENNIPQDNTIAR